MSQSLRTGVTDFREIADAYHQRSEAQIVLDKVAGQAGTTRHRVGLSAFGPTARQLGQMRLHNEAVAFNRKHVLKDISFVEEEATAVTPVLLECSAPNFDKFLMVVRKAGLLERSEEKVAIRTAAEEVLAFAKGAGQRGARDIAEAFPSLAPALDSMMVMPQSAGFGFIHHARLAVRSADAARRALALDAAPGHKFRQCTLGSCLDTYWAARHRPIYSGEWTGPALLGAQEESACFKAGHCVCSSGGKRLYRFRNAFLRAMKSLTPKDTAERKALGDGMLVWRLRGRMRNSFFDGASEDGDTSSSSMVEQRFVFWHVASINFSAYQPVFQPMECRAAEDGIDLPDDELAVTAILGKGPCPRDRHKEQSIQTI